MAGLGFKDFQVGEVLTSSDVDGYLMQQAVMRFADSGARGSALGTAPGTAVALAEGMVSYLDDTNTVQMYDGNAWVGIGNFSASTAIVATDASWPVPTLADPIVRVTVVGGGGGGGGVATTNGGAGSSSSFVATGINISASGGLGGGKPGAGNGDDGTDGYAAGNGGSGGSSEIGAGDFQNGLDGRGGQVTVAYVNLSAISTVNVTVGAGGSGGTGTNNGGAGGDGVVIVEYRAA